MDGRPPELLDPEALQRHVDNALIAEQLPPIERAKFLARCAEVAAARARIMVDNSPNTWTPSKSTGSTL